MIAAEKLVQKTLAAGSAGVKKTDLRKEFGDQLDSALEACLTQGLIFVEKRGGAYYCWHKDFFIQSLLNTDPRFKLTYDLIKSLEESVNTSSKDVSRNLEQLAKNISNLAGLIVNKSEPRISASAAPTRVTMSASEFKKEFDAALAGLSSSIGWVELAKIRTQICDQCNISGEEFYRLVGELTSQHLEKYELSTGGGEGVMIRGLLHGFVRCI